MTTVDQFAAIGETMCLVDLLAKEELHSIPCGSIHQRLVDAWVPLASVLHFSDVSPTGQDVVQLAATEPRLRRAELDAFIGQSFDERIQ